ncbi:general odorant-binding protein 28a [Culex quinquefasciatus]|uniref:general odorant-binding protein 28a n=1 Tax=Culex quinquefasciatus TaxID=7176 RepID=UPI0018E3B891|nr:general odorant-binding protein 28a [Culex quinquefasciatus]
MNYFCVSIILAMISSAYCGGIDDMKRDCMEQEGASQADADAMNQLQFPETRTRKCFYACIFEKMGTSDGQRFDTERFLEIAETHFKDDQNMLNAVRAIADRCDGTENDDRCELGADIAACMKGE